MNIKMNQNRILDVIVPIYLGLDETIECIKSVIHSKNDNCYNLILVNDCSPDPKLIGELKQFEGLPQLLIIHNITNLGFVESVNRGMELNKQNDVILLNSDTVVPHGWLDAIVSKSCSDITIGTITPLSNRATICSLPKFNFDNQMPLDFDVNRINSICRKLNPGVVVEIPTAVGFCMYIRRELLDQIGLFDNLKWGKGYCEENDFSLKAESLGWKNVVLCDTFVQHHGSVSFQSEKSSRLSQNIKLLNETYPDYLSRVESFIKEDPISVFRNKINVHIFSETYHSYVLHISHSWGGGIDKYINEIGLEDHQNDVGSLVLKSKNGRILIELNGHGEILSYPINISQNTLINDLNSFFIKNLHYHHIAGLPVFVLDLANLLKLDYFYTSHDFYSICPRSNFVNHLNDFCDFPFESDCNACLNDAKNPAPLGATVQLESFVNLDAWRDYFATWLKKTKKIYSPSNDTATRLTNFFGNLPIEVKSHEQNLSYSILPEGRKNNVLLIGAIGPHKGFYRLLDLVRHAEQHYPELMFHIVGYTMNDKDLTKYQNVKIYGQYNDSTLPEVIKKVECSCALFLSIWPETYSYTLSEAIQNNVYPIVLDIGAPAERLREFDVGMILPIESTLSEICKALINATSIFDLKSPIK